MAERERWATRVGLVLAMAGNAVGLGNFLRFPAQAAQNGGGAFMIPYIVAIVLLGLPLMWIEWTLGRYGGSLGHHSAPGVLQSMGKSRLWKYAGVMGLWTVLIVSAFYVYIESWALAYAWHSIVGGFEAESGGDFFARLTGDEPNNIMSVSAWGLGFFAACILLNVYVLSRGLARGIELVAKVCMPILIVFAAVIAVRGLMVDPATDPEAVDSAMTGLNFVWEPKFDRLSSPSVWLAAAGQVFFTLSIGMGAILCYSSYLRSKDDVALTGTTTAWTNEFCEVILGGTILIPIGVAYLGMPKMVETVEAGGGFSLGFMVFPELFQKWGAFAPAAGLLWFGMLFFAAITSSLAMGQPLMAFLQDEFKMSRGKSALCFGGLLSLLAVPVAIFHMNSFNAEFDYYAGTFMLVVFALFEVILFGWVFGIEKGWAELRRGAELKIPIVFKFIIKWVTPLLLILVLIGSFLEPKAGWETHIEAWTSEEVEAPEWEFAPKSFIGKLLHEDLPITDEMSVEEAAFTEDLRTLRNVDRLVMVAVFAFMAWLVSRAWKRKEKGAAA